MRTSFALGLMLLLGSSMQAQNPGIFGNRTYPGAGPSVTPDANKFPIPQQSFSLFRKLSNLIPGRFTAPISQPTLPTTTMPSYSPLMPATYLNAFHYLPPGTRSPLK